MAKPRIAQLYYKGTFDAAHYLPGYDGDCAKMHGHTWKVEVWITGAIDEGTGMVLDFRNIQRVLADYDHTLLNEILSPPTAENIAMRLRRELPLATRIRVWESDHSYAEVHRSLLREYADLTPAERDRLHEERKGAEVEMKPQEVDAEGVVGRIVKRSWTPAHDVSPYDPAEVQRGLSNL